MNTKTIILFDMDGTLTPARMAATEVVGKTLAKLSKHAKIGIVTGSDFDYLIQQCECLWDGIATASPEDFFLMPCNGTKLYTWEGSSWTLQQEVNMRDEVGDKNFDELIKLLITTQFGFSCSDHNLPLTGHFISYRGSMINWCPIGRNANNEQRDAFIKWDKEHNMRAGILEELQRLVDNIFGQENVSLALGGNTSIDIYPSGWDKTYALKYFLDYDCWFVGDRCEENGNDKTIYDALSSSGRSYKTTGPEMTSEIIDDIISRLNTELKK